LIRRRRYHRRFGFHPLFFTTDPDYVRSVMLDVTESYALLSISKALLVAPENHFYYTSPYLTGEERTFICADNIEPEHIVCWSTTSCQRSTSDLPRMLDHFRTEGEAYRLSNDDAIATGP
jgi:hypothetical protein